MRLAPAIFLLAIAAGAWNHFSSGAVSRSDGIIAPDDPVQVNAPHARAFSVNGYEVTPVAEFSLEARTLSVEKYRFGREADLAPIDLALGWGPMSDTRVLDQLQISQGNRFYHYRWSDQPPIPVREIVEHSANMHMIPANEDVNKRLDAVRVGQVVRLSGYLVRVRAPDGWQWNSSLTRSDSGNGACELVWVEKVTVH